MLSNATGIPTPETRVPPAPGRGRLLRWGAWAAALLAAALALSVATVALLLPAERIAAAAAERAEAAIGLPVRIAEVELDLWPAPAVALRGARVGEQAQAVAAADRIVLRPRLLPLLRGEVSIRQIELERPRLVVEIGPDGSLNLPLPEGSGTENGGGDVRFSVDELRVRDGRLAYGDARDGTRVRLNGIQQRLRIRGEVRAGALARVGLDGSLAVDSIDADLPGRLAVPIRGLRLALAHAGSLDRERDRLDLESLRLEIQRVALEGRGRVEAVSDSSARRVRLELRTDEFSADDLFASFPRGFLESLLAGEEGGAEAPPTGASAQRPEVNGRATIQARIQGLATRDSLPRVEGMVQLAGVGARAGGRLVAEGIGGAIAFSERGVSSRGLDGRFFGAPFRLEFRVEDLADPRIAFATAGSAPLEDLVRLAGLEDSLSAAGRAPFNLRGTLVPARPERSEVRGTVGLSGLRLARPSLRQPLHLLGGQLRFAGDQLHAEGVRAGFGESRLRADATVSRWIPAALGDTAVLPEVRFEVNAARLDLDALLGPSESTYATLLFARLADRPIGGRTAAQAAASAGLALPELPRLRAAGRLRAERLVRGGIEYRDVDAQLESLPGALAVPRARFGLMGGTVELELALERSATDALLAVDYRLENVGAEPFFARLTPFRGRLSGLLGIRGSAGMQLDQHLLPVRSSVQASGDATLSNGALAAWPVLRAAGERLGIARLDTLSFREWTGAYRVVGPLVTLERAVQSGGSIETELAGSFDFGGRLDLGVTSYLPAELAARAAEPVRQAAAVAAGGSGRVPLGLRITGQSAAPQIGLDLSAVRGAVVAQARGRARQEAQEAAGRAAQEVAGRVLPDSVPLRPDSVAGAVRSRVTERLQGLFRRPAPAPAPAPQAADSVAADTAGVAARGEEPGG